jgi:hypothetical protein
MIQITDGLISQRSRMSVAGKIYSMLVCQGEVYHATSSHNAHNAHNDALPIAC